MPRKWSYIQKVNLSHPLNHIVEFSWKIYFYAGPSTFWSLTAKFRWLSIFLAALYEMKVLLLVALVCICGIRLDNFQPRFLESVDWNWKTAASLDIKWISYWVLVLYYLNIFSEVRRLTKIQLYRLVFKKIRHKTLSLNLPNVKFDFNVTVEIMQVLTDTSNSNSMLKWGLIIACKWVFDICVRSCNLSTYTDTTKTLHRSRIRHSVFSVIEAYDQKIMPS